MFKYIHKEVKKLYFYKFPNKWQPTSPFLVDITRYFFLKKHSYLTHLLKYESQFYNQAQV